MVSDKNIQVSQPFVKNAKWHLTWKNCQFSCRHNIRMTASYNTHQCQQFVELSASEFQNRVVWPSDDILWKRRPDSVQTLQRRLGTDIDGNWLGDRDAGINRWRRSLATGNICRQIDGRRRWRWAGTRQNSLRHVSRNYWPESIERSPLRYHLRRPENGRRSHKARVRRGSRRRPRKQGTEKGGVWWAWGPSDGPRHSKKWRDCELPESICTRYNITNY